VKRFAGILAWSIGWGVLGLIFGGWLLGMVRATW
jgi:hypothetical protein